MVQVMKIELLDRKRIQFVVRKSREGTSDRSATERFVSKFQRDFDAFFDVYSWTPEDLEGFLIQEDLSEELIDILFDQNVIFLSFL